MKELKVEILSREAFAPFGDVIELEGAKRFSINNGTSIRYYDLANMDFNGARPVMSIFRPKPCRLPQEIVKMACHPIGTQAFVPMSDHPFLVAVAPAGQFDPEKLRVFVTKGRQGVNYAKGTWHHTLLALDKKCDFLVLDRGVDESDNLEEWHNTGDSMWINEQAVLEARRKIGVVDGLKKRY